MDLADSPARQSFCRQQPLQGECCKKRIIAERYLPAFRGYWRQREPKCGREDSFSELFGFLGDRDEQDEIRESTPHQRHCGLLESDPSACLRCQLEENPFRGHTGEVKAYLELQGEVLSVYCLLSDLELGVMNRDDLLGLTPDEFDLLLAAREVKKDQEMERQAMMIVGSLFPSSGSPGGEE